MLEEIQTTVAARTLDRLLADLLNAQLDSLGLFSADNALLTDAGLAEWRKHAGLLPLYERWLAESLRLLCEYGYLQKTAEGFTVLRRALPAPGDAWTQWQARQQEWLADKTLGAQVKLLDATLRALPRILTGKLRATGVVFAQASTAQVGSVYASNPIADHFNTVLADTLAAYVQERRKHDSEAHLRILEVGAGTGGTSATVLARLEPMAQSIAQYCYTDISAAFLLQAEERFAARYPFVDFQLFNVEKPLSGSALQAGSFDAVIAANVLHATRNIRNTLRHTKAMLRRNGWLLLNEVCANALSTHLTFGLLEGWWLFDDAAVRLPGAPLLSASNWRHVLQTEGFQQIFFPAEDAEDLGQQIIVAESDGVIRRQGSRLQEPSPPAMQPPVAPATQAAEQAEEIESCEAPAPPSAPPQAGQLNDQVLMEHAREAIRGSLAAAVKIEERRIEDHCSFADYGVDSIIAISLANKVSDRYGITLPATVVFDYNSVNDLARHLLDTQRAAVVASVALAKVKSGELGAVPQAAAAPARKVISRRAKRRAPREATAQMQPAPIALMPPGAGVYYRAQVSRPGGIDDLEIIAARAPELKPHEVRVAVHAFSMNFGDLLCVKGLYPTMPPYPFTPGVEVGGVVTQVGSAVTMVQPGDAVVAMLGLAFGGHATMVVCPETQLWRKPPKLSFEAACALPAVAITMVDVFRRVQLQRGQKILIQTATGGTGLIAVQLAQHIGAEIFATAGSAAKLDYLRELGVPHVINYREQDFAGEIKRLTAGGGVDVVINTLAGEALQKGLSCLAAGGRYVEIAMTGLKAAKAVDLSVLNCNQAFYSVDLGKLGLHDPVRIGSLLKELADLIQCEVIRPTLSEVVPFERLKDAYRQMENRANIGKVVVSIPQAYRFAAGSSLPQHAAAPLQASDEIAVIGMSGVFPKSADLAELWEHLAQGHNLIEEVSRWDLSRYGVEANSAGVCRHGGFLGHIDAFDALFFNISTAEATYMDPQQRLFLQEAWHALENAGYAGESMDACRCGVYVGCAPGDYGALFGGKAPPQAFWGNAGSVVPARIAYYLNLQGPAIAIDTACSSSLVAMHLACQGLWRHEMEMAIAGGVFVQSTAGFYLSTRGAGMLSVTGACHAFDSRADGFVPGEGVAAVVLKRLDDALQAGDHVYGVIRGSGINQDGTTHGITAPSAVSQQRLQRQVYDSFGIHPEEIQVIEAHGTGTQLGDPIEIQSLTKAFRQDTQRRHFCAIGSIKTNLGHTASTAGVAGVIKILLSLQHRQIPPSLHYANSNPHIDFADSPFYVNTSLSDWNADADARRCAAVSSFGISGTNAHMVIAEAPAQARRHAQRPAYLIVLSARTAEQLQEQVARLVRHCEKHLDTADLGNISFTLLVGRKHMRHRLACVAASGEELVKNLQRWLEKGRSAQVYVSQVKESERRELASMQQHGERCIEECRQNLAPGAHADHLATIAELYLQGYPLAYQRLFEGDGYCRVPLPAYPFARERYWVEMPALPVLAPESSAATLEVAQERTLLLAAQWREAEAVRQSSYQRQWVVVIGEGGGEGSARVSADHWTCDDSSPAARFEFYGLKLLALLQDILRTKLRTPVLLQLVIDQREHDLLSGLSGMLKTARLENPLLHGQLISLDLRADNLQQTLQADAATADAEIRYARGVREVLALEESTLPAPSLPWQAKGVYLITGGAGGLGLIFARAIAQSVASPRLILTGRSGPGERTQAAIESLRKLGAEVEYQSADVADRAAVAALLAHIDERYARLDGVIHGAGVIRDSFLLNKTPEEYLAVLAPKVRGVVNLDEAIGARPLDCFVLFSSGTGAFGNVGQADYAAANAFLDSYAHYRELLVQRGQRHGRTLSVGWPLWAEGGMQVPPAHREQLRAQGWIALETGDGVAALYQALGSGHCHVQVLRLLCDAAERHHAAATPHPHPLPEGEGVRQTRAHPPPRGEGGGEGPRDSALIKEKTLHQLRLLLSEVTQLRVSQIDATEPLESYGIDSIMIGKLNGKLAAVFGNLSKTLFYEYPTLQELRDYLFAEQVEECVRWCGIESHPAPVGLSEAGTAALARSPSPRPSPRERGSAGTPIAVIGLSGRYAQAFDIDAYWENLRAGKDCIGEIPADRWALEDFHQPDPEQAFLQGKSYCRWGGFIEGFAEFDPQFFNLSPREAMVIDPQERLFLQGCWHALEDAGYTRESLVSRHHRNVGVFAGITKTGFDLYGPELWRRGEPQMVHTSFGSLANRVSYVLNLGGPSMPIDTMCSASLTAVHEACEHLLRDECELALAGGVNLYLHPSNYAMMCSTRMLSADGRCKSFGAGGNGFVPGEGVGVVLLKPLSRALSDGDHIYGSILGTSINHGGKTNGYTVPNPVAQGELIRKALDRAGVNARTVSYIEAHGTGTELGDPIEITGLVQAFAADTQDKQFCAIGSVKSNIGHCESAAGIAGLTKILLQMKHGQLAPSLHAAELNPLIDFANSPFAVQRELAEWQRPRIAVNGQVKEYPRIAGISSFGAGGANAHVIVQEHVPAEARATVAVTAGHPPIFVLSAKSEERLQARIAQLSSALAGNAFDAADLPDIAYTLQVGREAMEHRLAFTAVTLSELQRKLHACLAQQWDREECHRGEVKRNKEALAAFTADEDLQLAIQAWLEKGKLAKLMDLWVKGLPFDWNRLYGAARPRRISLPVYPFERRPFWMFGPESLAPGPAVSAGRTAQAHALHPLVHLNTSELAGQRFTSVFSGDEFFLADHRVGTARVLPAVAYLEMVRVAVEQSLDPRALQPTDASAAPSVAIRNIAWLQPLIVNAPTPVHVALHASEAGDIEFEVYTTAAQEPERIVHAQGRALLTGATAVEPLQLQEWRKSCDTEIAAPDAYARLAAMGLNYGPAYQGMRWLRAGTSTAGRRIVAEIHLPECMADTAGQFVLHPSVMDSALQTALGLTLGTTAASPAEAAGPYLPFALDELQIIQRCPAQVFSCVRACTTTSDASKLDIDICDAQGAVCVRLKGFTSRQLTQPDAQPPAAAGDRLMLLAPRWDSVPRPFVAAWPAPHANVVMIGGTSEQRSSFGAHFPHLQALDAQPDEGIEVLAERLSACGVVDHLVWVTPRLPADNCLTDALITAQESGVVAGFRLIKALLQLDYGARALGLTAITWQAQSITAAEPVNPAPASVHGLLGSLAKEYPAWNVRLVDLPAEGASPIDEVLRLPAAAQGDAWAYRSGEWYRQQLLRAQPRPVHDLPYREGGVYVVIGGAGGIGEVFSEHLIRRHRAQLIWIGRRALDAGIESKLARLAALGPRPLYLQADATDRDALETAYREIKRRHGEVHGVVHSALALLDSSLANMEEALFRAGLAAKVAVSARLAEVFEPHSLDFVLFFSALQSFGKAAGQSNYAAGCTFADAFAAAMAQSWPCAVKVMNWGYWGSVGIVASDYYRQRMAQMGIASIEPDDGMDGLDALLRSAFGQLVFVKLAHPRALGEMIGEEQLISLPQGVRLPASPGERSFEPPLQQANESAPHAAQRQIEQLQAAVLYVQLQALGLCAADSPVDAPDAQSLQQVMRRAGLKPLYERWLAQSLAVLCEHALLQRDAENRFVPAAASVDATKVWSDWEQCRNSMPNAQMDLLDATLRALPEILTGATPATSILFANSSIGRVEGMYRNNAVSDYYNEVLVQALLAHVQQRLQAEPGRSLRIIEIGAGTGGTSALVFEKLKPWQASIAEYAYTDISNAFLLHAKQRFLAGNPFLRCQMFDVEQPLQAQSIELGSYDVAIATNVLHATRNIRTTLRNAKAALRSDGLLLVNEIGCFSLLAHLTFGLLEGWWLYEDDGLRIPGSPALTPDGWRRVLREEGFYDVGLLTRPDPSSFQHVIAAVSDGVIRQKDVQPAVTHSVNRPPAVQAAPASGETPAAAKAAQPAATGSRQALESQVRQVITQVVAASLQIEVGLIDFDESFADYGLDSILGVHAVHAIAEQLGIQLSSTSLFDYSTVNKLAAHILAQHQPRGIELPQLPATPVETEAPVQEVRRGRKPRAGMQAVATQPPLEQASAPAAVQRGPIAVIGMSGRYPKSASLDELWEHLKNADDLLEGLPAPGASQGRFAAAAHAASSGYRRGVMPGADQFDALFFNISGAEATFMDPQQRVFLEEAWKALEDAGYAGTAIEGRQCGVYLGCSNGDYGTLFSSEVPPQAFWGNTGSVTPARICYFLNLQGPAVAVDTACSSSLVATHMACQSLWMREVEVALAGGVFIQSGPQFYLSTANAGMLSPTGRCHTFDDRADGFVASEGAGVLLLKRLEEAQAAGDHIHGVIRGIGINQDGATNGITAPSALSQERLECQVYDSFGIHPERIQVVEAHGTGTKLGDPIEYQALTRAFRRQTARKQYCAIGSIKTNLGHAAAAAGVAGVIKVLLSLRHGRIAPSLNFERGNPHIDFADSPFYVNTALQSWEVPAGQKRCAAVSSFGFSGTNAHVVIEEAPASTRTHEHRGAYLIALSARTAEQLRQQATRLVSHCEAHPGIDCGNVSYTLLLGRRHLNHRLACVTGSIDELEQQLRQWLEKGSAAGVYAGELPDRQRQEKASLKGYAQQCAAEYRALEDVSACRDRLATLAEFYIDGQALEFERLFGEGYCRLPLPSYPFARTRYWVEPGPRATEAAVAPAVHEPADELPKTSTRARPAQLKGLSLEQCVQWELKQALSSLLKVGREQLQAHESLAQYGVDSLSLAELARRLSTQYGIELTPAVFFSHPTLAKITAYLLQEHAVALKDFYGEGLPATPSLRPRTSLPATHYAPPASHSSAEPIAIIGMSGRFPQARSVAQMWELLVQERSAVEEIPLKRFDWREPYAAQEISSKWLGAVPGVAEFDPLFFEISPREAQAMDPRQRLLLQEAFKALEDAAYGAEQFAGQRIGMFVGVEQGEYQMMAAGGSLTSNHDGILASRLSYCLNLRGPAMAINTSCSSALVAAHQACLSLRAGECDAAVAAGVNLILTVQGYLGMSQAGMLSAEGRCYAFDRRANGMVPGEAVVAVVLKQLHRAQADGDPIHAVIRGSGINYDGKTNGITAPNGASQAQLIKDVYQRCGINARDIGYVVTHGTGTRLGDPVEINALDAAFRTHTSDTGFCALSSTKTNFGHSFAASGLVSLASAVQALKHGVIPASLNCEQQSEYIEWARSAFYVNGSTRAWDIEPGQVRRAAVSAFGMSGTNAHMVLEEYCPQEHSAAEPAAHQLLVLSAKSSEALRHRAQDLLALLQSEDWDSERLQAMSHTLACGRQHFNHRCAVVIEGRDHAICLLREIGAPERLPNVFRGTVPPEFCEQKGLAHYAGELAAKLASLRSQPVEHLEALQVLADLYCQGYALPFKAMCGAPAPRRIGLPAYPFATQEYWIASTGVARSPAKAALHPLVHANTSDVAGLRFTSVFTSKDAHLGPELEDGARLLPAAACLEMACAALQHGAAMTAGGGFDLCMHDLVFAQPLAVGGSPLPVHVQMQAETLEAVGFEIVSEGDPQEEFVHAQGAACVEPACGTERLDLAALRGAAAGDAQGRIEVVDLDMPAAHSEGADAYLLHPSLIEAALQAGLGFTAGEGVLRKLRRLRIYCRIGSHARAVLRRDSGPAGALDIQICDGAGNVCVHMQGVEFTARRITTAPQEGVQLMTFQEQWEAAPLPTVAAPRIQRLVFFADGEAMSLSVAKALRAVSPELKLIVVEPAAKAAMLAAQRYGVAPGDVASCRQVLGEIAATHGEMDALVYGWGWTQAGSEHGWQHLLCMLQGLATSTAKCERLVLCAGYEQALSRCHAESWIGIERSLKVLSPQLQVAVVLQEQPVDVETCAAHVWQELQNPSLGTVMHGADGCRYAAKLAMPELHEGRSALREGGTYWIIGAGGLGWHCAQYLSRRYGANVVLSGRRELDEAGRERLQALQQAGGHALYVVADVSDANQARHCLEQILARFGSLHGVIHAAGMSDAALLPQKDAARFAQVLGPKVLGTKVLDEVLKAQAPDFVCYFSSIAAVLGDFGGGDYAMANRFEMAYADHCAGVDAGRRIAIEWPLWSDGGMSLGEADATELYLQSSGQQALPLERGLAVFERLLQQPSGHYIVLYGEPQRVRRFLERRTAGFAAPQGQPASPVQQRQRRAQLKGLSIEACVLWELQEQAGKLLQMEREQIEAQRNLAEYGFDSINLAELAKRLSQHFSIQLTPSVFFSCPTLAKLSACLQRDFGSQIQALYGQPALPSPALSPVATPKLAARRRLRQAVSTTHASSACSLASSQQPVGQLADSPIAIIGMAGRFPQARSVTQMWALLLEGCEAVQEIPLARFDWRESYVSGKMAAKWLGMLPGVDEFDPLFFEISPREAQAMDPRQRLLLQEAFKALEDAGYGSEQLQAQRIGMFVGVEQGEYQYLTGGGSLTGTHDGILASRLSYCLDLRGPAMALNTSCSSGLVAAHQACMSLRLGECDAALAAGVNLMLTAQVYVGMSQAGMLSAAGRCYAFDRRADGLVPGEAVVAVLLKRLARAQADGDPIHAVIRGSGINYDGKTNGITAPNGASQAQLIADVYRQCGLNAREIGYIVTHGTGTRLGDPVEINALNEVFKSHTAEEGFCALTSTKTNFGHSFAASGLVSLVSAVMAVKHAVIPASLNCEQRNEYIEWHRSAFYVNPETRPWPDEPSGVRRAAVSAFGMSGTNAHMVVEQYREPAPVALSAAPCHLLVLSAKSAESLQQRALDLIEALQSGEWDSARLQLMSHTLLCGRQHFKHRYAVVAEDRDNAVHLLQQLGTAAQMPNVFHGAVPREFNGQPVLLQYAQDLLGRIGSQQDSAAKLQQSLCALADLYCQGYRLQWRQLFGERSLQRIALPAYPFAQERYWVEPNFTGAATTPVREPVLPVEKYLRKQWQLANGDTAQPALETAVLILANEATQALAQALKHTLAAASRVVDLDQPEAFKDVQPAQFGGLIDVAGCAAGEQDSLRWLEPLQQWVDARSQSGGMALCVTQGLERHENSQVNLGGALRSGLYRMLQSEYSRVNSRHLDLEPNTELAAQVAQIAKELDLKSEDVEVCYRHGERYSALLQEASLQSAGENARRSFPEDGVLLITGGTRGLGYLCAQHFVRHYGVKRLVLTGRESLPEPNQWPQLAEADDALGRKLRGLLALGSQGAEIHVSSVDLSDAQTLRAEVQNIARGVGAIRGVIHCAGLADTQTPAFIRKPLAGIQAVLLPKVQGLNTLLEALADAPLEWCVLFSSVSAIVPRLAVGQSDYAMANAYMDYVAEAQAAQGARILSIQWGSWKDSGMGEARSRAYQQSGLLSHGDAEGLKLLDRVLSARLSGVILPAWVDAQQWRPEGLLRRNASSLQATDYRQEQRPSASSLVPRAAGRILPWLRELFAQHLKIDLERLDSDTPLPDYGVDSVMLMQVLKPINERVGDTLDPSILYEHSTLSAFAGWLLDKYAAVLGEQGHEAQGARLGSEHSAATHSPRLASRPLASPIAIIGLACRFAGANDLDEYWQLLSRGESAIRRVPPERWGMPSEHYAGLLDDIRHFDPQYFHLSLADAQAMDPQALLVLEESLKVLHHAGYPPAEVKGSSMGVYLGARSQHYPDEQRLRAAQHPILATGQNYLASNVSHYFDLRGPSLVVDTACSSALVALNMAMQGLRSGEVSAALVGGVGVLQSDAAMQMFEQRGILQREGAFHIFDARAQGAILGEGVGMVLLKTLEQAQADGDRIYAVISAAAINNDGRTAGPTAPNIQAQKEVMQSALARSGRRAEEISYIDVNGSGSEVTDLLELKAIESVYRSGSGVPCELGSMKPNIGHPLCAEGIASLIKVALMLYHGQRVPFLSALEPLQHYDFKQSAFRFTRTLSGWGDAPRVAAINSFADGGTNAHVIVEACLATGYTPSRQDMPPPALRKIPLRAVQPAAQGDKVIVLEAGVRTAKLPEHAALQAELVEEGAWE